MALFRGRRAAGGIARLSDVLARTRESARTEKHVPAARRRLASSQWDLAADLVARVAACLGPLAEATRTGRAMSLSDAAELLLTALRASAADETGSDAALWQGAGAAALAYGGFSFTKETHRAEIGPLKLSVQEKQNVNIPSWVGLAAIVAGVVLLVVPTKR
jgi:multidrug transporter EmrE-like cation transporter